LPSGATGIAFGRDCLCRDLPGGVFSHVVAASLEHPLRMIASVPTIARLRIRVLMSQDLSRNRVGRISHARGDTREVQKKLGEALRMQRLHD
jgi:hypothetical protein